MPLAGVVEGREVAAERGLVVRREIERAAGPAGGVGGAALPLGPVQQRSGGLAGAIAPVGPLAVEPVLELDRRAGHVEAVHEGTVIERERGLRVARRQRLVHRGRVAPERRLRHADLVVTAAGHDLGSERRAEEIDRPPEGGAGMLLVELRPEEGQQGVAAMEPAGRGDGEIGEQGEALGLAQHRAELFAGGVTQVEQAERPETDHRVEDGAEWGITQRRGGAPSVPFRP